MNKPLITILVPTRERCETLGPALQTCLDQDYDQMEVIVSDNCSRDDTRQVVQAHQDRRLRYIRPDRRLSMTGNFEFALSHARPGYLCFIGDDDGLMPGAVATVADIVEQTGAAAVAGSTVSYFWPSFRLTEYRNKLVIRDARPGWECYAPMSKAAEAIRFRRFYHFVHGLPGVYRGFISSTILARATHDGRYFHSITPDGYSAFVNSFFLEEMVYSHRPLTVEGTSGRSNGASQSEASDGGAEESVFLSENDIPFHPDLSYAPNNCILLAESFLQAQARFPERARGLTCDLDRMCATAVWSARGQANGERVRSAVAAMRARHGLPARPLSYRQRLVHHWEQLRIQINTRAIDCARFGATDIHAASLLAHSALHTGSPNSIGGVRYVMHKLNAKWRGRHERPARGATTEA